MCVCWFTINMQILFNARIRNTAPVVKKSLTTQQIAICIFCTELYPNLMQSLEKMEIFIHAHK